MATLKLIEVEREKPLPAVLHTLNRAMADQLGAALDERVTQFVGEADLQVQLNASPPEAPA